MQTNVTQKIPLVVIIGPTASGKSDLAVELALRLGGEVVSADSRQIYRGLDIGSGKITKEEMRGVPHHLLDVADPREQWSVAQYQTLAKRKIKEIRDRGKLPILCGGTAQYIKSIVDGVVFPDVPPNPELRACLRNSPIVQLHCKLKELDPRRAAEIEKDNPMRLVRAIEIATALGSVPKQSKLNTPYSVLLLGLRPPPDELRFRIRSRLFSRLNSGMIEEVEQLQTDGVSWERLDDLGLEYRFISRHLRGLLTKNEMLAKIETASWQYSRRQLTWWKKDSRVHWLWENQAEKSLALIQRFLTA